MLRRNKSSIPRWKHIIGKTYTDKNTGKKVKFIIVKFNSWKSRKQLYNARPKHFTSSKRKPGQHLFSVSVNLTRRRYLLLNKAKELIKDCESSVCVPRPSALILGPRPPKYCKNKFKNKAYYLVKIILIQD